MQPDAMREPTAEQYNARDRLRTGRNGGELERSAARLAAAVEQAKQLTGMATVL